MDLQQALALGLVVIAAVFLLLTRVRGGRSGSCGPGCACGENEPPHSRTTHRAGDPAA